MSVNADQLFRRGQQEIKTRPALSIALIEKMLEMSPDHPKALEALKLMSQGYQSLKRLREGGFLLESLVDLEPHQLTHYVRLCAFRLTRANYRKAAEMLKRYLKAGGTPELLEKELGAQQHPRSVVRGMMALCFILETRRLADLPHFKNMGEIFALEEELRGKLGRAESEMPIGNLPGVNSEMAARLAAAGLTSIRQLAAVSAEELTGMGFDEWEAENLVDVANSEVYLSQSQGGRPAEGRS